ncbi:hypothetical protein RJT34_07813 [Clitoria ternatea]|uniref:Uncharacterized protein n=1 Tax=Clitoria ternatea TaxID=43366 RepID=A0AAN9K5G2_CLITE
MRQISLAKYINGSLACDDAFPLVAILPQDLKLFLCDPLLSSYICLASIAVKEFLQIALCGSQLDSTFISEVITLSNATVEEKVKMTSAAKENDVLSDEMSKALPLNVEPDVYQRSFQTKNEMDGGDDPKLSKIEKSTLETTNTFDNGLGKKLDALFGRTFKAAKFKPIVKFAISCLDVIRLALDSPALMSFNSSNLVTMNKPHLE